MPPGCRGNNILALPPARKGRHGSDLVDKCALHPWARAQNQPSKGKKIKSILLLSTLCSFFAPQETLDLITKKTRIVSVIYSLTEDQAETKKKHNTVFFNTKLWDSHPFASPEGSGTIPSKTCERWSNTEPLGAAMRLTALRPSPTYVSRQPKHFWQMKSKSKPNDLYSPLLYHCKPTSSESAK